MCVPRMAPMIMTVRMTVATAITMIVAMVVRIFAHPRYCTRARILFTPFLIVIGHFDTSPARIN